MDGGEERTTVTTVNGRTVVVGTKDGRVRINDGQSIIALSPAAAIVLAEQLRQAASVCGSSCAAAETTA